MALGQQAGTEDRLHPCLTPPPMPLSLPHFPFSLTSAPWIPCALLLPSYPHPTSRCPTIGHGRSSIAPSLRPLLTPPPGWGGGQSPALRLHWGRWGYNAASRAGSCQLVITAKKETHACAQEHTHIPACSRVNQGGHRLATVLSKSSMGMPGERCTQK